MRVLAHRPSRMSKCPRLTAYAVFGGVDVEVSCDAVPILHRLFELTMM